MELKNFLNKEALELFLKTKGWKMLQPIIIEENAVFKPDFYAENYTIAQAKFGRICAKGQSIINYQGDTFESVSMLIIKHGENAIKDFDNWEFIEEMEWVIYKNADWLHSFSNLLELPKASKYRC
tara:strand:- start:374 stop:748 length:375 start_codon:yes stop_codon:yes gene_type:complete